MPANLKDYVSLTKPGIIRGNLLTAAAGFLLASNGRINVGLLFVALSGIALIIASGCVFNNYIDRGIDMKMARTKQRALASGAISTRSALTYGTFLGIGGFLVLGLYTNYLTVATGLVGLLFYVIAYSYWKRRSTLGTLVGSVSGATPPVAGYLAVTNHIDGAAVILFFILVTWQMPHFYAIAMYRLKDYKAASIPVLPAVKGMKNTQVQILLYIVTFTITASLLTVYNYTGYTYLIVVILLGSAWFGLGILKLRSLNESKWARTMFFYSLAVITLLSGAISLGPILP